MAGVATRAVRPGGLKGDIVRAGGRTSIGYILFLMVAVAATPGAGAAQTAAPVQLQQLVAKPDYQASLARQFAHLPPDVFQHCPGLVSKGSTVTVIQPVIFGSDGYPTAGMWEQRFPVSGCGNDTTINFFFVGHPDGNVQSIVAAPGDTHADPVLQRDSFRYVLTAVHLVAPACTALHVRTTSFDGGDAGARGPWRETWTVAACGPTYRVPVTFTPDATGTQITAGAAALVQP
jgi:hypothetical protein